MLLVTVTLGEEGGDVATGMNENIQILHIVTTVFVGN